MKDIFNNMEKIMNNFYEATDKFISKYKEKEEG